MYFHKTSPIIKKAFPAMEWSKSTREKQVFLSFDDGPIPNVTEYVLDTLDHYGVKALFFMVGQNIEKHPKIAEMVLQAGHQIGNHTYNHLNGWRTSDEHYFENVAKTDTIIRELGYVPNGRMLFRPPYGRISLIQRQHLQTMFRIIMWDVLTGDFDPNLNASVCLNRCIKKTSEGSIITFHDNIKATDKLQYVLPRFLAYLSEKEYTCSTL